MDSGKKDLGETKRKGPLQYRKTKEEEEEGEKKTQGRVCRLSAGHDGEEARNLEKEVAQMRSK